MHGERAPRRRNAPAHSSASGLAWRTREPTAPATPNVQPCVESTARDVPHVGVASHRPAMRGEHAKRIRSLLKPPFEACGTSEPTTMAGRTTQEASGRAWRTREPTAPATPNVQPCVVNMQSGFAPLSKPMESQCRSP